MIIGIVGPIAGGKSTLAELLVQLSNGLKIEADAIVHQLLSKAEITAAVAAHFGPTVVPDGAIDRKRLAERIFGSQPFAVADRRWLEELLHPLVRREVLRALETSQSTEPSRWVVLDIPLLLEAGYGPLCDRVVYADSPPEICVARAARRGWSDAELTARQALQWPLDKKRSLSTDRVDCGGSLDELREQVTAMVERWRSEKMLAGDDQHRRSQKFQ